MVKEMTKLLNICRVVWSPRLGGWKYTMKTNIAGEFIRWESGFREWVTADGARGPSGQGGFQAEPSRYHLYVSYACPWAHSTLIFRALKGDASHRAINPTGIVPLGPRLDFMQPHGRGRAWHD